MIESFRSIGDLLRWIKLWNLKYLSFSPSPHASRLCHQATDFLPSIMLFHCAYFWPLDCEWNSISPRHSRYLRESLHTENFIIIFSSCSFFKLVKTISWLKVGLVVAFSVVVFFFLRRLLSLSYTLTLTYASD